MNRKKKSHLTTEERCHIYALFKRGFSKRAISLTIGVAHSTIVREMQRNAGKNGYRCKQANAAACGRRTHTSSVPRRLTQKIIALVEKELIQTQASPQQISGRLKSLHSISISHETIYKHILKDKALGGTLYKNLRRQTRKYNKRIGKTAGRGLIPNRVDIEQRPKIVAKKSRFGDLELDTIIGKNHKGAIVSIVDRASKVTILKLVKNAKATTVTKAIVHALKQFGPKNMHTMTSDNGKEFSQHGKISKKLGINFFFAKPYRSWERGLNEHTNGLVRQYLPKKTDFTKITKKDVAIIQSKLNNRPRVILNFKTPLETAFSLCPDLPSGAFQN